MSAINLLPFSTTNEVSSEEIYLNFFNTSLNPLEVSIVTPTTLILNHIALSTNGVNIPANSFVTATLMTNSGLGGKFIATPLSVTLTDSDGVTVVVSSINNLTLPPGILMTMQLQLSSGVKLNSGVCVSVSS